MKRTRQGLGSRVSGLGTSINSVSITSPQPPDPRPSSPGFTLIEVLVAIGVASILFGICTTLFVKASQYKSRSEKLLFMAEEANGALARVARDIQGLYSGGSVLDQYWRTEDPDGAAFRKLTLLTATENQGKADYCTVSYYVQNGNLYREVSGILGGVAPSAPATWPDKVVLAEKVDRITFAFPEIAGKVPKYVEVTLQMSDPDGRPLAGTAYRRFGVTVRPGSEENQ